MTGWPSDVRARAGERRAGRAAGEPARRPASHYLMRVLPYRTATATVDGVVVTFVDITSAGRRPSGSSGRWSTS